MKQLLFKILSLLLIAAMLLPMAVACSEEPPQSNENEGNGEGEGEGGQNPTETEKLDYVSATLTGYDELPLVDFTSVEMAQINKNFTANQTTDATLNKTVYKWNTASALNFVFTGEVDVQKYHFVEFTLLIPEGFSGSLYVELGGIGSTSLKPEHSGWLTYRIRTDSFSVKNPYPKALSIGFSTSVNTEIRITDIKLASPIYELTPPEGVSLSDASHYEYITDRYVLTQVGTPEQAVNPSAERQSRVVTIDDRCRRTLLKFPENFSPDTFCKLFGVEINLRDNPSYGDQDDSVGLGVRSFYNQINVMAIAYACYGGNYYKNADVLNKIKQCLEYGYKFLYGEPILQNGKTWGDWYNWDIATPDHLLAVLCLIRDELTQAEINKYIAPYLALVSRPYGTASNLLQFCRQQVMAGALTNDAMRIMIASEQAQDAYTNIDEIDASKPIIPTNDGFYSDGSFVQHNTIAYTGSYGMGLLGGTISLISLTAGGIFEPHGDTVQNHFNWIFDSFLSIIYGKSFFTTVNGRDTLLDSDSSKTRLVVGHALSMIEYAPDDIKARLMSEVRALQLLFDDNFAADAPLHMIDFCIALKNDNTVAPAQMQEYGKVFGAMDRVAQHTSKYGVAIALSSTRIAKYESINTQNEAAWYQGDGMIYIYTDGYDYSKNFYYYANPYLMPGTTVNTATRKYECLSPALLGTNAFSGGVQQGKYASAGFILSYNSNYAWVSNTFTNINDTKISAKKSYFMFDNEIVCIGSDITDKSGYDVLTVVENRLWRSDDVLSINGIAQSVTAVTVDAHSPQAPQTTVEARTMHFTNMGGYVFIRTDENGNDKDQNVLSYAKVNNPFLEKGESQYASAAEIQSLKNHREDFLEITINHGVIGDEAGKYAYVYLPEATVTETEDYYSNPDVEILTRSTAHAVIEKTLGVVACNVFSRTAVNVNGFADYTALTKIDAKHPCSIMVTKNEDGSYLISVSDPTQLNTSTELDITISGISEVVSANTRVNATVDNGTVKIKVNTKNMIGQTFNLTVK